MILSFILATGASGAVARMPAAQTLPADSVSIAVTRAVEARLHQMGSSATFAISTRIADQVLPQGLAEVRVGTSNGPFPRSRVGVPLWLWVDGRPIRQMTVWIAMHDTHDVAVFAQDYPALTPTSGVRLQTRQVDLTCCSGAVLADGNLPNGARLRVPVHAGSPAMAGDFEAIPTVAANTSVHIAVHRGSVDLAVKGLALADGGMGDMVAVRLEHGAQTFRARVVGPQQVQIDE